MRRLVSIALVGVLTGCTAAKASLQIVNADQALLRAESQGAPEIATYEYTMAKLYVEKAKEEAGYSEFRIADALARQSAEWSDRAVIFVEKRGRTSFELDDFELPERTTPVPEPTTATPAPNEDWLEESNPSTVPGAGPGAAPEEAPPEKPKEEPDPFEIEEAEDEIEIGGVPKPAPKPEGEEGTIEDTGSPQ